MKAKRIEGAPMARAIKENIRTRIADDPALVRPRLVSLALGDNDPSSRVYLASQKKTAAKVGIELDQLVLAADCSQAEALARIEALNSDPGVHGIMIQRPLPEGIDGLALIQGLDPAKDVEGIHPENLGRLVHGKPGLMPCTAEAALRLFRSLEVPTRGLEVVVVGHSEIVGKPIALSLVHELATVTLCHIGTRELKAHTCRADLLFVAAGVPGLIRGEMIKPGAVVIDIGINPVKDTNGKVCLVGDVAFAEAEEKAGHITPVPGGVGPVTAAILMENTWKAARELHS